MSISRNNSQLLIHFPRKRCPFCGKVHIDWYNRFIWGFKEFRKIVDFLFSCEEYFVKFDCKENVFTEFLSKTCENKIPWSQLNSRLEINSWKYTMIYLCKSWFHGIIVQKWSRENKTLWSPTLCQFVEKK